MSVASRGACPLYARRAARLCRAGKIGSVLEAEIAHNALKLVKVLQGVRLTEPKRIGSCKATGYTRVGGLMSSLVWARSQRTNGLNDRPSSVEARKNAGFAAWASQGGLVIPFAVLELAWTSVRIFTRLG